ncbi:U2 small nuclear ribonucleoprotein A'-like [Haliotis rubra]|uniref:U2 small nuclear ribonucleoprotein A'-like n=1 Tax=Haliotis rubra TaxID=36100 RepID=UPI001EE52306|nr:U2 small nuclear ribonucleoprotein A'-like [Haliotis rubra]
MVRLTAELIEQSAQYTNPVRDRELDMRGYRIPVIENLGATLDQFDTIDFSDNDIRKLDGFPLLRRLKSLLFNNNRIVRIGERLEESLPNMETLILTNNGLQELGDLDNLGSLKTLLHLSLLRNPVTAKKLYRLYVIHKCPQLRVLDFQRIKLKERELAAKTFKGKKGQQLVSDIGKRSKTFVPGEKLPEKRAAAASLSTGPSREEIESIKRAIASAKTLEEVERLNQMLKTGQVPGKENVPAKKSRGDVEEEEEMDT